MFELKMLCSLYMLVASRRKYHVQPFTTTQWLDMQMNTECVLHSLLLEVWDCHELTTYVGYNQIL